MHRLTRGEAEYFSCVDYVKTFGQVAEHGSRTARHIVALASYIQTRPGIAECAFVVDDEFQGRGLGTLMLEHLAAAASQAGIGAFEAEVLGSDSAMLEVFAATGLPTARKVSGGVVHLELPTSLSPGARGIRAPGPRSCATSSTSTPVAEMDLNRSSIRKCNLNAEPYGPSTNPSTLLATAGASAPGDPPT